MVSIEKKVSEVLNKGFKPFPGTQDRYWDMGVIHQESITLINTLLRNLVELIKTEYKLEFDTNEFIKKQYE